MWRYQARVVEVVMRSSAASVVGYIAEQPKEWQPTLKKLRAACRDHLRGYTESMAYGMPSYAGSGQIEVGFGKQARYLSLYILKQSVFEAHRADFAGLNLGKGCIRYRQPDQVDWDIVSGFLQTPRPVRTESADLASVANLMPRLMPSGISGASA